MGDFEIIETGFSIADETINFGTRSIGIGSLYEISTVGCFKSDEDNSGVRDVSINCLVNNGQIILSIDRNLKIFDDTKLSNLSFTAQFDANIASLIASPDNRFMLICLENGVVNVTHSKGSDGIVPIFTKCLSTTTSGNAGYVEGFLEDFNSQTMSFLVVYNSGAIFRLSIKVNNDSGDIFEVCPEEIFNSKSQMLRASFVYPTLLTNGGECSILNTVTKDVCSDVAYEIKKVFPLKRKFVALDFQGNLWKICPLTLICFPLEYNALLDDIIVINDGKKCQIFAVTKPNETGETFLQLLDTDFSQIFSLKISHPVYLIDTNSTTDDLLFISKVMKDDVVAELRLQSVYETEPELRLTRLIRRRRFDEAEKFAKSFDIDPVVISKAKAQLIVEKSECTSQDIGNLMRLMDTIRDDFFNLQCCSNVDCGRFEDVRKILTYAANIPAKNDDASQDMKRLLLDLLFRFDTFMAISRNEDDIQSWYKFSTCNLIEELKVHLKNYEIEEAILIYSRMDQKALDELTEDCVEDILCILNNLPISVYQPFLPTFIPITVVHLPTSLPIFVKWLYAKIFLLEKRDKLNFPQSGIALAENVLKLLKVEKNSLFFQRQCTLNKKSIGELAALIEGLKILQQLKKQFRIDVDLSDYLKGPETLIHTLLTSNMTPDDYENLLEQFLLNYMLQNNFDPDVIFLEEIKILLNYDQCWLSLIEALLKHVTSVRIKLEATKEILECSPVPWCETIRKIASNALQYSHPLVQVIETILKDEKRLIVMRNPKYRIKEKQINNHHELEYIIRKMMYVNEPTLVEDVFQLCQSTEDRCKASWFLIENFIMKRNFDEALAVLNKIGKAEVLACTRWFVSSAIISINSKKCPQERKDNYLNKSLFLLFERLSRSYQVQNLIEKRQFEEDFRNIRGVYSINKYFDRSLTTYDLMSAKKKRVALDDLLEEIADNVREGPATIDSILTYADKLALWFDIDKDRLLIDLCEKVGKFDVVLTVAEHLYETESSPRNLCSIAVLFLKYLGSQVSPLAGESFDESLMMTTVCLDVTRSARDPADGDVFLRGLRFARAVLAKAMCSAEREDFPFLEEVMCWVNSCFYLTRQESDLQKKLFGGVFSPKQTTPSFAVVNSIRNWFHLYIGYIEKLKGPHRMHLSNLNRNVSLVTLEQFQYELSSLPSIIDTFCREGQSLTAFKLVKTLITAFGMITPKETALLECLRAVMSSKCVPYLLHSVVSADAIDVDLLYNLLLATNKSYLKHVHHFLKLYKRQPKKFRDIATIGIRLLDVHGETLGRDVMANAAVTCKWWGRLERVRSKIQYDEFFKADADARLRMLIGLDVVDVGTVRAYCEDFQLNVEHFYREFLKGCLVNWKPEYKITTNLDGKKSLVMLNDEHTLLAKCQEIINQLDDKSAVFTMMEKILKIANVYHYEVFICIYTILSNNVQNSTCRSTDINLLLFLKGYSRFSAPSQREREEWYTMFPDNQSLDPLSEFRLPFSQLLFTSDIWSILRPEISLKSYRLWFEGTSMLSKNLKIDDVCVYAVKQVVSSRVLEENSSQEWILHPKFEDLFQEVDECLENISDPEKAASVVYHLMNNTPNGADKVNAARLSYKYAFKYKEKNPDSFDVETAYNKVKNKYYRFSAMHILHKFNLSDQKYLNLVTQPDTLIENLYMDPRIIKQVGSVNLEYPDINEAVDSLAELFRLDIMKMRRGLVNHWLSNTSDVGLDSTSLFPPQMSEQAKIVYDDDNLKRATYICGSGDVEKWQTHLLKVGLFEDKNDEHKSLSFKAKALKCFCAITDEEKIAELTKITYQQFLDFVNKLTLLSELECLGISLTIETLDPYNKKELLKRLSQIGKPLAIKSMASICMTYFLVENRYWDYIIKSSIKLGMIEELRVYVDYLKNKCENRYYVKAWQVIIEHSFQGITCSSGSALEEKMVENFLMIQSCPVLFNLQFEKIVQMCINMSKFEYAAVLLQYLPENQRASYVQEIMKSDTVLVDLENLDSKGIWGTQNIRRWLESKD